jgi:DNA-binding NtrC family response regulator
VYSKHLSPRAGLPLVQSATPTAPNTFAVPSRASSALKTGPSPAPPPTRAAPANSKAAAPESAQGRQASPPPSASVPIGRKAVPSGAHSDEIILGVLRETGFNKSKAARVLGMHRTQVRRWVKDHKDDLPTGDDGGD